MREILFRGKNIDNGKWIYGGYVHLHKTTYCYAGSDDGNNDIHRIVFERMTDWNLPNQHMMADVLPETVGQFTGLTDKNGVRIFEGDILKSTIKIIDCDDEGFSISHYDKEDIGIVEWRGGGFMLAHKSRTCARSFYGRGSYVIGNIHDNPELLEGGGDNGRNKT